MAGCAVGVTLSRSYLPIEALRLCLFFHARTGACAMVGSEAFRTHRKRRSGSGVLHGVGSVRGPRTVITIALCSASSDRTSGVRALDGDASRPPVDYARSVRPASLAVCSRVSTLMVLPIAVRSSGSRSGCRPCPRPRNGLRHPGHLGQKRQNGQNAPPLSLCPFRPLCPQPRLWRPAGLPWRDTADYRPSAPPQAETSTAHSPVLPARRVRACSRQP